MVNILDIARGNEQPQINMNKLRELCSRKSVSDYFRLDMAGFLNLSESKQSQLTTRFYFENINTVTTQQQQPTDTSIGSIIKSSDIINLTKVYENDENRTEMSLSTTKNSGEKKSKSVTMWSRNGFFADECCNFSLEKANLPENTLFYVNQGYQSYRDGKKCYYNDVYIVVQIMSLAHQSKDIESCNCKGEKVKILRTKYDPANGKLLGIEYCVALITVKNDPEEQFFHYGYVKTNSRMLYSTRKSKIPSSFKATTFGTHKNQYEGGVFLEQDFSKIFLYLHYTVDRCEEINKYLTSVYLKP